MLERGKFSGDENIVHYRKNFSYTVTPQMCIQRACTELV
jgi:hypothetical protein